MSEAPAPERLSWVDTARGIGIVLVVYAHALRGHVNSGAYDPAWRADVQDAVIYSFHMPLFFFLAGLFVPRALSGGTARFWRDKATRLAYPYFLWSAVSIGLATLAAGAVNHAVQADAVLKLWRTPVYQYWFLYALAICHAIAFVSRADRRATLLLCAASAVGLGATGAGMVSIAFGFYLYFGLGILMANKASGFSSRRLAVALAVTLCTLLFAVSYVAGDVRPERALFVVRALLGIGAIVGLSILVAPRSRWIAFCGTASLAIYVLHTIFSAGTRMGLREIGFTHDLAALILGTVIGIAGPLAVWAIARHFGVLPWLGLGGALRNWQERAR